MKSYTVQLTKTIVVNIEAESEDAALEYATNVDDGYDGAWDNAEPDAVVLGEAEDFE